MLTIRPPRWRNVSRRCAARCPVIRRTLALLILGFLAGCAMPAKRATPLLRAHAHNDYAHGRPLQDAVDCGFCSIEVDILLVGEQLMVGHDRNQITPGRTLERLYLDPLRKRVATHAG